MRLRHWLLGALVALAISGVLAVPASAYPARYCGKHSGGKLFSHLKRTGNYKCPAARTLTTEYLRNRRSPSGYSCSYQSSTLYCRSKSNQTKFFYWRK